MDTKKRANKKYRWASEKSESQFHGPNSQVRSDSEAAELWEAREGDAVVVLAEVVTVDEVLDAPELIHVAWDADGALLVEAELILRLLEEAPKQRVVHMHHRDHKSLPLLSLPHDNPQETLRNIPQLLPLTLMAMAVVE